MDDGLNASEADQAADSLWQQALDDARQRGMEPEEAAAEFRAWSGVHPDAAAAGEIQAFLARDTSEGSARVAGQDWPIHFEPGDRAADWIHISGTSLSQPIDVRLGMRAGRPRVIGLRIDNGEEVTADFLREIRLGQIVEEVLRFSDVGPAPDLSRVPFKERESVLFDWAAPGMFLDALPELEADDIRKAKRGTPPPDSALRNFARIYLTHLRSKPYGAMASAARAIPIARSTAYRWAELCRERGYLPQEGGEDG